MYVKVANGGRQFMSGPYKGFIGYQDATGKWYVVDSQGKRVYVWKVYSNFKEIW